MTTAVRATATDEVRRAPPALPPLVGRQAELDRLRRAWRRAEAGRRQVVLVAGEPGMGKTTLLAELARHVAGSGGWVLAGGCPEDVLVPWAPLAEAIGSAAPAVPVDLLAPNAVLAHMAPELRGRVSAAPVPGDRAELLDAVARLVSGLARRAPVLLALDDLHRVDRSSAQALAHVLGGSRRDPFMVVGAYSDTLVDRANPFSIVLDALATDRSTTHIALAGLARGVLRGIIEAPAVADAIWDRADGSPLFLDELLRHVDPSMPSVDPRTLPRSFDDAVARRLVGLGPVTRQLVAVAALVGPELTLDTVAATGEVPTHRVLGAVEEAVDARLLTPSGAPSRYRFTHELVRRAVSRRVAPQRGVRLHARIGQVLERLTSPSRSHLAHLAFHAAAAAPVGVSVAAADHAARAGEEAAAALAWEDAASYYGQALSLLGTTDPGTRARRARLLVSLGDVQWRAGEGGRPRQAYLEAAALAGAVGDDGCLADAREAITGLPAAGGDDPVPPAPPPPGDHATLGAMLRAQHLRSWGPEDLDDRRRAAETAVAAAMAAGDRELEAHSLAWRLVDRLEAGELAGVDEDLAAHAHLAAALEGPSHRMDAAALSAMRALLDGRQADARRAAGLVRRLGEQSGEHEDAAAWAQRYWLALEWGDDGELAAAEAAGRALARRQASGAAWHAVQALLLARTGRLDEAAASLGMISPHDVSARPHDSDWLQLAACAAEAGWILADARLAPALAPGLEPLADRLVVVMGGRACLGSGARLLGLVEATTGHWAAADRHLARAVESHRRLGARPLVARTLADRGSALVRQGRRADHARAERLVGEAAELAAGLGMHRLAAEISRWWPARPGS